jgi:hypothetical protein
MPSEGTKKENKMTGLQAFWHLLETLQHATSQAGDMTTNANGSPSGHWTYGGSAIQAFLNALYSGGQQVMVWIDNAS